MSILIKGMEMPKSCSECGQFRWNNFLQSDVCRIAEAIGDSGRFHSEDEGIENRASWCPLVPIPPHGRLIDAGYADGYNASRWIPVKNRLPQEGELVLLYFESAKDTPNWRIQVGYLGNHDLEDNNFRKIGVAQVWYTDKFYWSFDKVVAWQPLPKPFKEVEE